MTSFNNKRTQEIWQSEFFSTHANAALAEGVERYKALLAERAWEIVGQCESPLEAAFAVWWTAYVQYPAFLTFELEHQVAVTVGDKNYRLDLVVVPSHTGMFRATKESERPKIAIELDGHDFHERTKEQVSRRNVRDRDLLAAGWQVWHISGSEFHRNPMGVIEAEYKRVFSLYNKAFPIQ